MAHRSRGAGAGRAAVGVTTISLTAVTNGAVGDPIKIGTGATAEYRVIDAIASLDVSFRDPLLFAHASGEAVVEAADDNRTLITAPLVRRQPDSAYFEYTILPIIFRRRTGRGVTVLMPKYVGPPPMREANFDRFIVLGERVFYEGGGDGSGGGRHMLALESDPLELWVDPDSPEHKGMRRAVWLQSFVA